jgi:hypothetical protein
MDLMRSTKLRLDPQAAEKAESAAIGFDQDKFKPGMVRRKWKCTKRLFEIGPYKESLGVSGVSELMRCL